MLPVTGDSCDIIGVPPCLEWTKALHSNTSSLLYGVNTDNHTHFDHAVQHDTTVLLPGRHQSHATIVRF